jgi:hypothetical protein
MPPPPPPKQEFYDLTMDQSEDEIHRRSVVPAENPLAQLIDLTERDDAPPTAGPAQHAQEVGRMFLKICLTRNSLRPRSTGNATSYHHGSASDVVLEMRINRRIKYIIHGQAGAEG